MGEFRRVWATKWDHLRRLLVLVLVLVLVPVLAGSMEEEV